MDAADVLVSLPVIVVAALPTWAFVVSGRWYRATHLRTFAYQQAAFGAMAVGPLLFAGHCGAVSLVRQISPGFELPFAALMALPALGAVVFLAAVGCETASLCYLCFFEHDDWRAAFPKVGRIPRERVAQLTDLARGRLPAEIKIEHVGGSISRRRGVGLGLLGLIWESAYMAMQTELRRGLIGALPEDGAFLRPWYWLLVVWLVGCCLAFIICALIYGKPRKGKEDQKA